MMIDGVVAVVDDDDMVMMMMMMIKWTNLMIMLLFS